MPAVRGHRRSIIEIRSWTVLVFAALIISAGCTLRPKPLAVTPELLQPIDGLQSPQYRENLFAIVAPPIDWRPEPFELQSGHAHQVWVSPSGRTAYGVIHYSLPLPFGHELVLRGFLREMRRSEGSAALLEKQWDSNLRLLRFVAQGGKYTVRTNLLVRGFEGWAVYAGTLAGEPVVPHELDLAERAREHTLVGRAAGHLAGIHQTR